MSTYCGNSGHTVLYRRLSGMMINNNSPVNKVDQTMHSYRYIQSYVVYGSEVGDCLFISAMFK